jgi:uncharacterized protein YndB with AHSA1/START domain
MARNTIYVDVPPDAVFEVLADPRFLANWVVGASRTRRLEGRWPEVGSVIHHTQLMLLNDTTTVVECDRPRRLRLEARARPLAVVDVDIRLDAEADGTRIVLDERTIGGLAAAAPRALNEVLIHLRNREAVRRLRWLAEIGRDLQAERSATSTA